MERLAKPHFLRVSRVCSVWHNIIMGTSSLWATIEVNLAEWSSLPIARRLTYLLSAAVERAGTCPLRLKIRTTGQSFETPGLTLLWECSQRWQSVNLWINSAAARHISFAAGNFPLLVALQIHGDFLQELHIFEVAPRLVEVTLRRSGAAHPPGLPWGQLLILNYEAGNAADLRAFMPLLLRCAILTTVNFLDLDVSGLNIPMALPPIESPIESLEINLRNTLDSNVAHARQTFSEILGSFTLPRITQLSFRMNASRPLFWPQRNFRAFASRSSCQNTVTSLTLHNIIIVEKELLDCLADLPHLEILAIADVPVIDAIHFDSQPLETDHILLTNSLLSELTRTSDAPCLIPHLRVFRFSSLFHFTAKALLNLVVSRVESLRTADGPFELEMRWCPELVPFLDPNLTRELDILQRRGNIVYSLDAFEWAFFQL
ncbi:hypothetical protein B0H11DRAFT_2025923 [Mycena galericulata]|nr:hypothetical protein B0H11DRAFT_2115969 [Mycena galericulata]KAJ7480376.1 hypothetical protein B0H11DRAFT_2025923 [Mycena galericulata]